MINSGQGFGLPGRVLVCLLGLIPPVLAVTGIWLWLRRRSHRRLATRSLATPERPAPAAAE